MQRSPQIRALVSSVTGQCYFCDGRASARADAAGTGGTGVVPEGLAELRRHVQEAYGATLALRPFSRVSHHGWASITRICRQDHDGIRPEELVALRSRNERPVLQSGNATGAMPAVAE